MGRVDAPFVIARMTDKHTRRDWAFVDLVCDTMRSPLTALIPDHSIAVSSETASIGPASIFKDLSALK
jgi:hypothetical protein